MKKYFVILFAIGCSAVMLKGQSLTQEARALEWASTIDSNDLKRHLFFLASDYLAGRETATEGNDMAADYIASFFQKNGLKAIDQDGDYFMDVPFTRFQPDSLSLKYDQKNLEAYKDYVVSPFQQRPLPSFEAEEIYFLGYAVEDQGYNDFGKFDWEEKVVLIYKTLPDEVKERLVDSSQFELTERLERLSAKGVKAALIVDEQFKSYSARIKRYVMASFLNLGVVNPDSLPLLPHAHLSTAAAEDIIGKKMKKFLAARDELINDGGLKGKPYKIKRYVFIDWVPSLSFTKSQNVLALLPGSNPNKEAEHIIVSAHYDHLGQRGDGIYNGADDNGSGTTTVLEVMETFAQAAKAGQGPERSILFMLVTGEEKGLLGSRYYADQPILPLTDAVANVNVDMVGRIDEKYQDSSEYIYVIGADRISNDLQDVHVRANEKGPNLILDYTYNEEDDPNRYYYRSDHYNFAKNGIPAIFFFNGTHEDYHRTTDTPDKIAFSSMAERAKLIFLTTWEIANRPQRLSIDYPVE